MKQVYAILLAILFSLNIFSQNRTPTSQTNQSLNFDNFLSGVKFAEILLAPEQETYIKTYPVTGELLYAIKDRMKKMGFEHVSLWTAEKIPQSELKSICDNVSVILHWNFADGAYRNITWTFISCNNDIFVFQAPENIGSGSYTDVDKKMYNLSIKMYGYQKPNYDESRRLKLNSESTNLTESKIKDYFNSKNIEMLEGIYENITTVGNQPKYKVAVKKTLTGYDLIYLGGAFNYLDWKEGDIKGKLIPTATSNLFKADWLMADKTKNSNFIVSFEQGLMNVLSEEQDKNIYIKLYPTSSFSNTTPSGVGSGSGFAISSDGYVVTNFHVIDGAKSIKIRGVNGNFEKVFKADVAVSDKNNDLAILKISDFNFNSLGNLPFNIAKVSSDVGTSIFVLGYPLRATMGDEVKLTNGIISSKSGFQGDITSYQISAPVQPGNSGGPLFDQSGNIIGVVNAKHGGAENASYAVKSTYLNNLIEQLPRGLILNLSLLKDKTLAEQAKIAKSFVYIVEVE